MSNIQLSSRTDRWGTPEEIIKRVNCTFSPHVIDMDPASSELANKTVKATKYLTEEDDGLTSDWGTNISVFINPPSGKVNGTGKTKLFWKKLIDYYLEGKLKQGLFLGFSVEQLSILQDCELDPLDFSLCIPRKRIKFDNLAGPKQNRPTHSNFICYISGSVDNRQNFFNCFSDLGKVVLNG